MRKIQIPCPRLIVRGPFKSLFYYNIFLYKKRRCKVYIAIYRARLAQWGIKPNEGNKILRIRVTGNRVGWMRLARARHPYQNTQTLSKDITKCPLSSIRQIHLSSTLRHIHLSSRLYNSKKFVQKQLPKIVQFLLVRN